MGTDDLHRKRKAQTIDELQRKKRQREQYKRLLIVCEGEAEVKYFKALCAHHGWYKPHVVILCAGTDPSKLLELVLAKYANDNDFDVIFCVFDKDTHKYYEDTLAKIEALRRNSESPIDIRAITSVPCFEYWLLLHFVDTMKPYLHKPRKSVSEQLIAVLKAEGCHYRKGATDTFEITKEHLNLAIKRSKRIYKQQQKDGFDNPSTRIHELVEYLIQFK